MDILGPLPNKKRQEVCGCHHGPVCGADQGITNKLRNSSHHRLHFPRTLSSQLWYLIKRLDRQRSTIFFEMFLLVLKYYGSKYFQDHGILSTNEWSAERFDFEIVSRLRYYVVKHQIDVETFLLLLVSAYYVKVNRSARVFLFWLART